MADVLGKKISELAETTDLAGLYTIGSDRNNQSKKVPLQFVKEAADYANAQGDYAKGVGDTVQGNTGVDEYPVFSASTQYAAGSVVRYNDKLYRFTSLHPAGSWVGTDAVETSIKAETELKLTELESEVNKDVYSLNGKVKVIPTSYCMTGVGGKFEIIYEADRITTALIPHLSDIIEIKGVVPAVFVWVDKNGIVVNRSNAQERARWYEGAEYLCISCNNSDNPQGYSDFVVWQEALFSEKVTNQINDVVKKMTLDGWKFCGFITPTSVPKKVSGQELQFYIACEKGVYVNFKERFTDSNIEVTGEEMYIVRNWESGGIAQESYYAEALGVFNIQGVKDFINDKLEHLVRYNGYTFGGVANPSSAPITYNQILLFYLAAQDGVYNNFVDYETQKPIVVKDEIVVLRQHEINGVRDGFVKEVLSISNGTETEIDSEIIYSAVNDWLDNHPEATSSVQDGSISTQKLDSSLSDKMERLRLDSRVVTNPSYEYGNELNTIVGDGNRGYGRGTGRGNCIMGTANMFFATTAHSNVAIGHHSQYRQVDGIECVSIGNEAQDNVNGSHNTAVGANALRAQKYSIFPGVVEESNPEQVAIEDGTAIGCDSQFYMAGSRNTSLGSDSLKGELREGLGCVGIENVAVGFSAKVHHNEGDSNTAIGAYAQAYLRKGNNNIALGFSAGKYHNDCSNRLFIDGLDRGNELGEESKSLIVGEFAEDIERQWVKINGLFSCNGAEPQSPIKAMDNATDMESAIALLNQIKSALVACGIMK